MQNLLVYSILTSIALVSGKDLVSFSQYFLPYYGQKNIEAIHLLERLKANAKKISQK